MCVCNAGQQTVLCCASFACFSRSLAMKIHLWLYRAAEDDMTPCHILYLALGTENKRGSPKFTQMWKIIHFYFALTILWLGLKPFALHIQI